MKRRTIPSGEQAANAARNSRRIIRAEGAEHQETAGSEHALRLHECRQRVVQPMQRQVGPDQVEAPSPERQDPNVCTVAVTPARQATRQRGGQPRTCRRRRSIRSSGRGKRMREQLVGTPPLPQPRSNARRVEPDDVEALGMRADFTVRSHRRSDRIRGSARAPLWEQRSAKVRLTTQKGE